MRRNAVESKCKNKDCSNSVADDGLVCTDCHELMCNKWHDEQVAKMGNSTSGDTV
mgnify:CR=1 FL=1